VAARSLPFPAMLWAIQNRCYEVLQTIDPQADPIWLAQFRELAGLLALRVE
jgi:hypothetical protein